MSYSAPIKEKSIKNDTSYFLKGAVFVGFVYSAAWLLIAIILFVRFRKESKIVILISIYFLFLGCWWFANEFVEVDLLHGTYAWILRFISVAVIAVCGIFYYLKMRKDKSN